MLISLGALCTCTDGRARAVPARSCVPVRAEWNGTGETGDRARRQIIAGFTNARDYR